MACSSFVRIRAKQRISRAKEAAGAPEKGCEVIEPTAGEKTVTAAGNSLVKTNSIPQERIICTKRDKR